MTDTDCVCIVSNEMKDKLVHLYGEEKANDLIDARALEGRDLLDERDLADIERSEPIIH